MGLNKLETHILALSMRLAPISVAWRFYVEKFREVIRSYSVPTDVAPSRGALCFGFTV